VLRNSFRLFSIGGIDVGIHISWLLIFALVTWSLATGFFPEAAREMMPGMRLGGAAAWILGAAAAILLFASVLLHELAHSFVARARGLGVHSITLFLFGGVSNLSGESKSPATEFLIAIVGPLTSFAIAIVAFGLAAIAGESALGLLLSYVAFVNVLLGLFNLIPGFPLDGGRVLRSIAWRVTNSVRRATEIAAGAGQIFGFALILWGLSMLLLQPAGDFFNGLWIAAIGWFLQSSATASLQQVIMETRLRDVRVGQVFRADPTSVAPDTTVAELIEGHLLQRNRRAMPVCDDGRAVGIVTLGDIKEVPPEERARTRVAEVMGGRDGLATVTPSDTLSRALELFGAHEYEQLPVVEDGRFLGLITRADVIRQLQLREALDVEPRAT
jgi:Zn-dependent protease/CBS domain-containing protein